MPILPRRTALHSAVLILLSTLALPALGAGGDEGVSTGPVLAPDGTWVATFVSVWRRKAAGGWEVVFDIGPRCPPPAGGTPSS